MRRKTVFTSDASLSEEIPCALCVPSKGSSEESSTQLASGFTLVEVLLALALLSSVLAGTLGVLQSGGKREALLLAEARAYELLPQPLPADRAGWDGLIRSLPGTAELRRGGGGEDSSGSWAWFHWRHEVDAQAVHIRLLVRVLP